MKSSRRIAELKKAVAIHLETHGPRKWKLVQEQFPDISERTFWRELRGLRDAIATIVDLEPIANGAAGITSDASQELTVAATAVQMSSPDDYFLQTERLFSGIEALEQHCVTVSNGRPQIQNPAIFRDVIKQRVAALNLVATHSDRLMMIRDSNDFTSAILEELEKESPEFALRVAARLKLVRAEFSPQGDVDNSAEGLRLKRAAQRREALEAHTKKARVATQQKLEAGRWSGSCAEVQAVLRLRLIAVLDHSQFSDRQLERFLECPTGSYFMEGLRKAQPPFIDLFRVQRLAFLKVRPNIRINLDWFFTGKGEPLIGVVGASAEALQDAATRSEQIRTRMTDVVMPMPPEALEEFFLPAKVQLPVSAAG